ncbi:uncharacterized protein K02A2.6-like [Pecten maximus]|uniref:uncharacterized protein K02A2.6-like n=1 Tax=Pecten maximus TaxID=6579 RepID=UPI0014589F00|nr:uncharacterized protein K02A2.6-like [Pecten maximus]
MGTLISDNGSQFASKEYEDFIGSHSMHHITSSPGHQQANGLAEKAVQSVKNLIKKSGDDIYMTSLDLRNTPRDDIGAPMQRLMVRRGETQLPITETLRRPEQGNIKANITSNLMEYRKTQKHYYDRGTKPREDFERGDALRVYSDKRWEPAELINKTEYPRSYIVKAGDKARECRRNSDLLMKTREIPYLIKQVERSNHVPTIPIQRPSKLSVQCAKTR